MKTLERVEAYACGICDRLFVDPVDAAACCCCTECHTKTKGMTAYAGKCGHCLYAGQLRFARAQVRRLEADLVDARKRLDRMLAEKKPTKGAEP